VTELDFMTRKPESPFSVRAEHLADHRSDAAIERVWERLDAHVQIARSRNAASPRQHRARRQRRVLVAAALAAGFSLGMGIGELIRSRAATPRPVAVLPADDPALQQVFAAGLAKQSYALPGGGQLAIGPGGIVDTVSFDARALTLRLIRGEAAVTSAGDSEQRVVLLVGGAQIATTGGSLRVHLRGATADLEVLAGFAEVAAPDPDSKQPRRHMRLGANDRATVPVRTLTASISTPAPNDLNAPEQRLPSPHKKTDVTKAPEADWATPCEAGEYDTALDAMHSRYGDLNEAIRRAPNPSALMCISRGIEWRGQDGAPRNGGDSAPADAKPNEPNNEMLAKAYGRLLEEFPEDVDRGALAAFGLQRIHRSAERNDEARKYGEIGHRLSNGHLLPEDALCQKIQAEAQSGSDEAVLRLSERYRSQFPDGRCSDTIDALVQHAKARTEAAKAAADQPSNDASNDEPPQTGEDKEQ